MTRRSSDTVPAPPTNPDALPLAAGGGSSRPQPVAIRKFPYPFRAALAICSDIDDTRNVDDFVEIHRFLNTHQETSMGRGLGLEIGNSFFFYDTKGCFSFAGGNDRTRGVIIDMIHAGYIDSLHSFGDAATTRDQIVRALDTLHDNHCHIDVFTNHYGAITDVAPMWNASLGVECQGDQPGAGAYHTDLTVPYGIRYIWVSSHTRVVGQSQDGAPITSLHYPFQWRHPLRAPTRVGKDLYKMARGWWGDRRYRLNGSNDLTRPIALRDGQRVHEFIRYCYDPGSFLRAGTAWGLAGVLSARNLEHLERTGGFMIAYTHLGQNRGSDDVVPPPTQAALRNLARAHEEGRIYVTTTSRLLNYYTVARYLNWTYEERDDRLEIHIDGLDDPAFGPHAPALGDLQGLTFYVPDSERADIYLERELLQGIERHPADDQGRESVSVPRVDLIFPDLHIHRAVTSVSVGESSQD